MQPAWLWLLVAYLVGSTPTAYAAGRLLKGIDLRTQGSGNLGATNVYRSLGAPAAIVVLLLDALKGAVPVLYFAGWAGARSDWWPIACGVVAIAGHVRPYFGAFRGGGKGVATASGVFAALSPYAYLAALSVFVVVLALTRFVSLGSMLGAVALAVSSAVLHGMESRVTWAAGALAVFVAFTHRANIARLRSGQEPRIGKPGAAGKTTTGAT